MLDFYNESSAHDLIFFLQHYDVFLQVAGVFSKFRPKACTSTYRSEPDSCRLAYGTAPFGPIESMIPLLMRTNNHRPKHRKEMGRHWRRNREDQIAHGNGRNLIGGRVRIIPMLKLCLLFAQTLLSWTRELASPPFRVTTIIGSQEWEYLRGLNVSALLVHAQGQHNQHY